MSKAISVRMNRTKTAGAAGGQRKHDLRVGRQPDYVDQERTRFNRVLIEPPFPSRLRARAEQRRAVSKPKRKMRKNASIAERGIITFGKDIQAAIRSDPDRADKVYIRVVDAIALEFGLNIHGLVVHEDEAAPHAHFWMDSFDNNGKAISQQLVRSGSRIQDIAAVAAREVMPEIERGVSKKARIEAGEDPARLRNRSVKEMHRDLGLGANPKANEVSEAVARKRELEAQADEARHVADEAWEDADHALLKKHFYEDEIRELEARRRPAQEVLTSALTNAHKAIEEGHVKPAEEEGHWFTNKPWWDKHGDTLNPGPLGWGAGLWSALRNFAATQVSSLKQQLKSLQEALLNRDHKIEGLEKELATRPTNADQKKLRSETVARLLQTVVWHAPPSPTTNSAMAKLFGDPDHDPSCLPEKNGLTVLHVATWKGRVDLVPLLLDAGYRPDQQSTKGHLAVDFASIQLKTSTDPERRKALEQIIELLEPPPSRQYTPSLTPGM